MSLEKTRAEMSTMADPDKPFLTPEQWRRAKQVMADAQDLSASEREKLLDEVGKDDSALREELESLFACEDVEVGVLDGPLFHALTEYLPELEDEPPSPRFGEGQRIGPYKVEKTLAEGGMGTVVLAVREDDFRKKVALKLIKSEQMSAELLSRFHLERQILASLDHPNIATILDGGTTEDDLPYFAMEHVEGEPIDRYCERHRLSVRQRLELFRQVCAAVQVAHQNLVVHRDLKPGNILVTADGVPKLIDFGIAKPLGSGLAPQGLATMPGTTVMTLKYASPEQVLGESVTVASDVYSLGVVLFQLLTGENPYPPDASRGLSLVWAICNLEPRRPSTVVTASQRPRSNEIAENDSPSLARFAEPPERPRERRKLRRHLSGDLDSIVLKALNKDPRRRYASVERFSADIRRHLVGLPVMAREGTAFYRFGKYIRRNRTWLAGLSFLLLVIVVSTVLTISSARRAERERMANEAADERASDAERQADALANLLAKIFIKDFGPDEVASGKAFTPDAWLERSEKEIVSNLESDPEVLATQLEALGVVYQKRGLYDRALPLLQRSLHLRRRLYNGDHSLLARGLSNLAACLYRTSDYRRAEILYREVLRMRRRLGQPERDHVKPMNTLASILMNRGEYQEAEEIYRKALALRKEAYGHEGDGVATTLLSLGTLFYVRGDFESAVEPLREALRIRRLVFGSDHSKVASVRSVLGRVTLAQGQLQQAEEQFTAVLSMRRKLLGEHHVHVALSKKDLAALRLAQGNPTQAEPLLVGAIKVLREQKGDDSWEVADAESLLGACLTEEGRLAEAEPLLSRAYLVLREARGDHAVYTRNARSRLEELHRTSDAPRAEQGTQTFE